MKKILLFFVLLSAFVVTSCVKSQESINGTYWKHYSEFVVDGDSVSYDATIYFTSSNEGETYTVSTRNGVKIEGGVNFTYYYGNNTVTIHTSEGATAVGTINGNEMTVKNAADKDDEGEVYVRGS